MGVASVWAVWWFGVRFSGRREALLAAALLTFSYHHLWFSQDARGYTGLLLWTLLATGLFLRLIRERSPEGVGLPIAYGAAMALGLYTHMTAAFVLAAHGLIWAGMRFRRLGRSAQPPRWSPLAGLLLALTFTLQLYAPVLPQLLQTLLAPTMPGSATEWKNPAWFVLETLRGLGRGLPGGMFAVLGGIGIALAGFGSYVRQERALAAAMILPGLLLGGTLLTLQHNLWPRLFFFSAAFGALILIRGIFVCAETVAASLLRRPGFGRPIAGTVCALLIIGSAWSARKAWAPKQDYRGARAFVEQRSAAEDVVATIDMTDLPYRGYLGLSWPSVTTPEDLNELRRGHRRVWIVYTFPTRLSAVHPRIWRRIQTDFTPIATFGGTVNGGEVIVGRSKDAEKGVGEPVAYFR